jgi:hypothetical protein
LHLIHLDRINAFFEALLIFWALIDYMQTQPTFAYIFKAICAFGDKNFPKLQPKKGRPFLLFTAHFLTLVIFWQLADVEDFKTFSHGPICPFLEDFFQRYPAILQL